MGDYNKSEWTEIKISELLRYQDQLKLLAEAVLNSHNGFSRDVPPVQYLECDCPACTTAREIVEVKG